MTSFETETRELRDRLTREGMVEARAGIGVDASEVKAWADSLPASETAPEPRMDGS
jgi:hypothetical protein